MEEKPSLDEAGERDLKRLRGELGAARRTRSDRERAYWISALEAEGLLPNYALLDDTTRLDVGLWWTDEETGEHKATDEQYVRGSRTALAELAPGATFYVRGTSVEIDGVDLGTTRNPATVARRFCPACGWSERVGPDATATACPRCHTPAAADSGQVLTTLPFRRASAYASRELAMRDDDTDERRRTRFTVLTTVESKRDDIMGTAWELDGYPFGAEVLRTADIRWLNLGPSERGGATRMIAGQEVTTPLFDTCRHCGVVPLAQRGVRERAECPAPGLVPATEGARPRRVDLARVDPRTAHPGRAAPGPADRAGRPDGAGVVPRRPAARAARGARRRSGPPRRRRGHRSGRKQRAVGDGAARPRPGRYRLPCPVRRSRSRARAAGQGARGAAQLPLPGGGCRCLSPVPAATRRAAPGRRRPPHGRDRPARRGARPLGTASHRDHHQDHAGSARHPDREAVPHIAAAVGQGSRRGADRVRDRAGRQRDDPLPAGPRRRALAARPAGQARRRHARLRPQQRRHADPEDRGLLRQQALALLAGGEPPRRRRGQARRTARPRLPGVGGDAPRPRRLRDGARREAGPTTVVARRSVRSTFVQVAQRVAAPEA